jgi:hypothetical protein
MPNEQENFLQDLEKDSTFDVFEEPLNETETPTVTDDEEQVDEEVKNRRHRRLEAKLQAEREANIAMASRLEALSEVSRVNKQNEPAEYLKAVERIYGTDSPESLAATELLKNAFSAVEERATQRALELYEEREKTRQAEMQKEEQLLDSMVEDIEDNFDVTFTPELQKKFFKQLEKLSPKDANGNVIQYADHRSVWEDFSSKLVKPVNPAKALSARSMTQGTQANDSKLQDDVQYRFLKENGII